MIDKTIPGKVSTHNNNRTKRIYQQQPSVASFRGPTENKKTPLFCTEVLNRTKRYDLWNNLYGYCNISRLSEVLLQGGRNN